jgi:hypothetical protein
VTELRERFAKFRLELHPDKTRLLPFGRTAWGRWRTRRGDKPGTFDFLGFTHISGMSRQGKYSLLRKTMRKRWHAKLREVRTELRRRMHEPIPTQGAYLRAVVGGHLRYFGVPGNGPQLAAFTSSVAGIWKRTLQRRSQKHRMPWERMMRYVARWIPSVRITHPWPSVRFDARTQGKSRMR